MRLIILRTCTCEVISHLYRNKLDVGERGERGPGGEGPSGRSGAKPLSGSFSVACRGTIKCNFTAVPQAGKERFLYLFQIKLFYKNFFQFHRPIHSTRRNHVNLSEGAFFSRNPNQKPKKIIIIFVWI